MEHLSENMEKIKINLQVDLDSLDKAVTSMNTDKSRTNIPCPHELKNIIDDIFMHNKCIYEEVTKVLPERDALMVTSKIISAIVDFSMRIPTE